MRTRKYNLKVSVLTTLLTTLMIVALTVGMVPAQQPERYFFTLHLVVPYVGPGVESDKAMQLKSDLAAIGINVEVHYMEKAEYYPRVWGLSYNKTWDEGGWDMDIGRFSWRQTGAMWFEGCWASVGMPPYGWDYFGWKNGIADRALHKGWTTINMTERLKYYSEFLWQFYLDPPAMAEYWPIIPQTFTTRFDVNATARNMGVPWDEMKINALTLLDLWEVQNAPFWVFSGEQGTQTVTIAQGTDPPDILPMFHSSGDDFNSGMSDSLVTAEWDPQLQKVVPKPELAKSYEWSEDGLTITFYLRDDAYWQDGVQITADDVAWTINAIIDPEVMAPGQGDYAALIRSAEVVNATTVRLHLKEPAPDLLTVLLGPWEGAICPKHVLENIPRGDLIRSWMNTEGPTAAHPDYVGSGPFKLVEWRKNEYLRFEAWPDWWGWKAYGNGKPTVKELIVKIIPDSSTALASFEAGEIDQIHPFLTLPIATEIPKAVARAPAKIGCILCPMQCIRFIGFNLANPYLNNVFVRRAICTAHNNTRVIEQILEGMGIPATGPIPLGHSLYPTDTPPPWTCNVTLARQYMEMAGYNYDYLKPPPEVPLSAYAMPAAVGLIVGAAVGAVAGRFTAKRRG